MKISKPIAIIGAYVFFAMGVVSSDDWIRTACIIGFLTCVALYAVAYWHQNIISWERYWILTLMLRMKNSGEYPHLIGICGFLEALEDQGDITPQRKEKFKRWAESRWRFYGFSPDEECYFFPKGPEGDKLRWAWVKHELKRLK